MGLVRASASLDRTRGGGRKGRLQLSKMYSGRLPIVAVAPGRGIDRRTDRHPHTRQDPRTLARGKTRRQQPIVDLPRYREAVERRCRQEETGIVREAVRRGVDIAFRGRDDAIAVPVYSCAFSGVSIEQPSLKVLDLRFERRPPYVNVEINLISQAARNAPLAKLALRIVVGVELVGITRKVGVVTDCLRLVFHTFRSRTGNDRLQLADFTILEGLRRLSEVVRKATGKGQFIKRVNP